MSVVELLLALRREVQGRTYIVRLDVLDQSTTMIKARLYISPDLFVQVYRNDRFDTTNMVLIYNERRVYGRDQVGGVWHRHTATAPQLHDVSDEGRRPVGLSDFLDEVESVLSAMDLP